MSLKTNNSSIILLGFMGSGKTTLGKKMAHKLNFNFIDLDEEIEKFENLAINEIFENYGENYFRKVENKMLKKVLNYKQPFVLAVGGGTPCFFKNMSLLNRSGITIYIKYNSGILTNRLINAKTERPLIKGKTQKELIAFMNKILLEREIFYNQSKFTIHKKNVNVNDILNLIKKGT